MNASEILSRLEAIAKLVDPQVNFQADSDIRKFEFDSMAIVSFFIDVEEAFGVDIPEDIIEDKKLTEVENLVFFIQASLA